MIRRIPPEYSYPMAYERRYVGAVTRLVDRLYSEARPRLLEAYSAELSDRNRVVKQDASLGIIHDRSFIRTDGPWIDSAIHAIGIQISGITAETVRIMTDLGEKIADFNERAWKRTIARNLTGVDVFGPNRWLFKLVREWSEENAKLITSIPKQFLDNVARMSSDAARAGTPVKQFAVELKKTYDLTKARSRLIARTETAKLNSQVTQQRQENLGITEYVWRTSGDERVRYSHKVLNGKICKWDDPTVYKDSLEDKAWKSRGGIGGTMTHPGMDFQCRCHSQAVINLDELLGAA